METAPRNCRFLSLVVVERVLTLISKVRHRWLRPRCDRLLKLSRLLESRRRPRGFEEAHHCLDGQGCLKRQRQEGVAKGMSATGVRSPFGRFIGQFVAFLFRKSFLTNFWSLYLSILSPSRQFFVNSWTLFICRFCLFFCPELLPDSLCLRNPGCATSLIVNLSIVCTNLNQEGSSTAPKLPLVAPLEVPVKAPFLSPTSSLPWALRESPPKKSCGPHGHINCYLEGYRKDSGETPP